MSDSRVVDALHTRGAWERLLHKIGYPATPLRENTNIRCPMPHHNDENPSCTVRIERQGLLHCQSRCGTIRGIDLIIEGGIARDPAEAMVFLEEILGIESDPKVIPDEPDVIDPSLTVKQYLAMKCLPLDIESKFDLWDVRAWIPARHRRAKYEPGMYTSVLMPCGHGFRPRVRACAPDTSVRWASLIERSDRSQVDYGKSGDEALPYRVYGIDQMRPIHPFDEVLIVVEGESDVHALHAMGATNCVGVPGVQMTAKVADSLVDAAQRLVDISGTSYPYTITDATIVVWQEPGSAGSEFPTLVARAYAEHCMKLGVASPRVMALPYDGLPGSPKDPCEMWQDFGERAGKIIFDTIASTIYDPAEALDIDDPLDRLNHERKEILVRIDDGARPAVSGPIVDSVSPAVSKRDPWFDIAALDSSPRYLDQVPVSLSIKGCRYIRTGDGWSAVVTSKDGDENDVPLCQALVIDRIDDAGGERFVTLAALDQQAGQVGWARERVPMSSLGSPNVAASTLKGRLGLVFRHARRDHVVDLVMALYADHRERHGSIKIAPATGWMGPVGSSLFAGIEAESTEMMSMMMFEANQARRSQHSDEASSAAAWWNACVAPLLTSPVLQARHAAPVLALGAAAAAPLIKPIADEGVMISPVSWLAGLGGGGKTMLQAVCASIFAPSSDGGQTVYSMSADASRAALNARANFCRDLPLILDDVTRMPAFNSGGRPGDAQRVEAAADLGMQIFNRRPSERATRDGGVRLSRAFRCTALFSAEISMRSDVGAKLTAGHRRRITTIECQPMTDRGLDKTYAAAVNRAASLHGGAAGSLLVASIRDAVARNELGGLFDRCRGAVVDAGGDVTDTQAESISLQVLGFCMLATCCTTQSFDESLDLAMQQITPFLTSSDGATSDEEIRQSKTALLRARELFAANRDRFYGYIEEVDEDAKLAVNQAALGKVVHCKDGRRRVIFLKPAMSLLENQYGVTRQMVDQAAQDGFCEASYRARVGGLNVRGVAWLLDGEDPDPEPEQPSPDPEPLVRDPHGLRDSTQDPAEESEAQNDSCEEHKKSDDDEEIPGCFTHAPDDTVSDAAAQDVLMTDSGESIPRPRFNYARGVYYLDQNPSGEMRAVVRQFIRSEARLEFDALRRTWQEEGGQAFSPRTYEVEDLPRVGDPKLQALEAFDAARADLTWKEAVDIARSLAAPDTSDDQQDQSIARMIKLMRIHLALRIHHPDLFIRVNDDVS